MRKQHVVDVPLELGGGALIARLELGADVGALFAAERHQAAAKWLLLALILQEAGDRIVARSGVGKARCVQRRLGHTSPYMRPRHESGVPQQRHASKDNARRLEIEDRLEEGLRARKNLRDLGRDERAGGRL